MKKIAIFGANGNIGHQAVAAFGEAGWRVRAVTREGIFKYGNSVETAAADAMDEAQVIDASQGCDFIFNGVNPPYPKWSTMCMPICANMMSAAKQHRAVHLFPGNVYNFGTKIPPVINNMTKQTANIAKGRIRIDMEAMFEKTARQHDVQTIILRAGDFYGGKAVGSSWFDQAITKALARGKMTYPGPMDVNHAWAYLPDFARAFVKISQQADQLSRFEVFEFEGHTLTGTQLKNGLETVIAQNLKLAGVPWPLMRLARIFSPMLRQVCEMSYLWNVPHRLDGSRLAEKIGIAPDTKIETALSQALADLDLEFLLNESLANSQLANAA